MRHMDRLQIESFDRIGKALAEKDATIAAKDAEIALLQEAIGKSNVALEEACIRQENRVAELAARDQRIAELDLQNVLHEVGKWAHDTFPNWSVEGQIEHVRRETIEIVDAYHHPNADDEDLGNELADPIIIIAHLAFERDIDLVAAIRRKHAINLRREWGEPDADGVVEHIR